MKRAACIFIVLALLLSIMVALPAGGALAAQVALWPGYQQNAQNTGRGTFPGPRAAGDKWYLGGVINGGITVGKNNMVYVGSASTLVAIYDRGDVCILSGSFKATSNITTGATLDPAGNLYFGCEDGNLFKVSPKLQVVWYVASGSRIIANPVVDASGNVYFANAQGLVKLGPDGKSLWSKGYTKPITGTPALDSKANIYFGAEVVEYGPLDILKLFPKYNWYLFGLKPDGSQIFKFASPSNLPIWGSPAVRDDGNVVFGNDEGKVSCVSPSGSKVWEWADAQKKPLQGGFAADKENNIYFANTSGVLRSLSAQGAERWSVQLPEGSSPVATPVLDSEARLYTPSKGMQCRNATDGSLQWSIDKSLASLPTLALGDQATLYYGIPSGAEAGIYAVGPKQQLQDAPEPPPGYSEVYYLAEGTTRKGFLEWLALANPNPNIEGAQVQIVYFMPGGDFQEQRMSLLPETSVTIDVNKTLGADKDVSVRVASTLPIIVERPMFFAYGGAIDGGHDATGVKQLSKEWYFAEGCTRDGFYEYLCIQNPQKVNANLSLEFMIQGEGLKTSRIVAPAESRTTVNVQDMIGHNKDVSVKIASDQLVLAERPMYFVYQGLAAHRWTGGHDAVGATSTQKLCYFAEGTTRSGFEEWLCIQNPSNISEISVTATYMFGPGQGAPIAKVYKVPPSQRYTVFVNNETGPEKDVSMRLECDMPFIAERPMYFDYKGTVNGGSNVMGAESGTTDLGFAFGTTQAGFEQWLCVLNPWTDVANITVTYYVANEAKIVKTYGIEPGTRFTQFLGNDVSPDKSFFATIKASIPVMAEIATYFRSDPLADGWAIRGQGL